MLRPRLPAALAAAGVIALLPGCLTLYSKTEVVRGDEQRRAVRFENALAAEAFQTAMKKHTGHVGGTYLGVPFVTFYSKDRQLSESARWNDAVARCDTDQDGLITCVEAKFYANAGD